jgi:hypothetical protein
MRQLLAFASWLLLPCLLFAHAVEAASLHDLSVVWILPFAAALHIAVGFGAGALLAKVCQLSAWRARVVVLSSALGSGNFFPIVVVHALAEQMVLLANPEPHSDPRALPLPDPSVYGSATHLTRQTNHQSESQRSEIVERGIGYIAYYLLVWSTLCWSVGWIYAAMPLAPQGATRLHDDHYHDQAAAQPAARPAARSSAGKSELAAEERAADEDGDEEEHGGLSQDDGCRVARGHSRVEWHGMNGGGAAPPAAAAAAEE